MRSLSLQPNDSLTTQRWLCRSASFASFPPRMRSKLQGPDSCPGRSYLLLNSPAFSWTHTEIPVFKADPPRAAQRQMLGG